ncbi:MAG: bifunctional adenosylcobinamide kinase/adenosylcobinamide-phosphate guanylyltransferase [Rhodoferax sp.]|nr:bifunctional adenosylcobinamide kinase/adenosylcobinamide-phosphate guanylyltransferase [Rhodoferax sp.]MBP7490567.1 bifunctional adenosylcobinamide kinase/adenosylcobinamide-phosphate guanylyltransferase [Rhodoferax sp.]
MADTSLGVARSEFILGGQKSGKSRRAEALAHQWLTASSEHHAVLIATAQPWDSEMEARIARHQADRAERVPGMRTVEEPLALTQTLRQYSTPQTLVVVDCLTLWLTNCLMPMTEVKASNGALAQPCPAQAAMLLEAISTAPGPVVIVGNEIGLGVIPMGREVRSFVDALGRLNQEVAGTCARVTLMVAGVPLTLKGGA